MSGTRSILRFVRQEVELVAFHILRCLRFLLAAR